MEQYYVLPQQHNGGISLVLSTKAVGTAFPKRAVYGIWRREAEKPTAQLLAAKAKQKQ